MCLKKLRDNRRSVTALYVEPVRYLLKKFETFSWCSALIEDLLGFHIISTLPYVPNFLTHKRIEL